MKKTIAVILALSLVSFSLFSQEEIHSILKDTVNLDEVVITGTTTKVNMANIPMAVSVVNNLQIASSSESNVLPILNGRVPGMFVTERGIMGFGVAANAAGQISIRGIGGSPTTRVLMLIDGHPQYMGLFGHPLADSYVASDVERVEVIRGPASILYGSNAMGGVINIITKKQTHEGLNANGHFMYGSYNTQKYMASGGLKKNKISLFASINHDQTDGQRPNSDFSITNGYVKFGWNISDNFTANADVSLAGFKATDPGTDTLDAVKGNTLDIMRGYWSLSVDNNYTSYSGSAKFFYNFGEHNISDGFHSTDANFGINIYEAIKLFAGNTLTAGVDYLKYGGFAENELVMNGQGIIFTDTSLYDAGLYGFMQQRLMERLTINAGIRYQKHEVYGGEWIPSGGFAFNVAENTTWKASVSKGFRSPTIQELFMWTHNPNLSPERIINSETGIIQSFFNKQIRLELTGFIVKGDNLIINIPMQGLQNAGEVSNKGIEFSANSNMIKDMDLNLTYAYIGMKSPVYATPKHHLYLSGNYRIRKFLFNTSLEYINGLDNDPSDKISEETYILVNAKVTYRALKYADLFLSIENILNTEYETLKYYPMPGITFFGGIKLKI
ncbi:MAG TPA: TonB-dependent receptor [Bacteroidales bacterium]|nr:TonB-dependent receptor [Bacteroidales bacterium]